MMDDLEICKAINKIEGIAVHYEDNKDYGNK